MPPTRDDVISVARESDAFLEDMRRLHRTRIRNAIKKGQKKLIAAVRKLDTDSSGNLVSTRVNIKLAEKVQRDAIGFFAEEYGVTVADLVEDFDEIADFIQRSWGDLDEAVSFTGIDKDIIDTLKNNALADYEQFGLQAQRRLANEMYSQVVGGGSFDTLLTTVTGIFEGHVDARGVPMAVHAQTHAFDSIMNFHNQVNLKKAEDLDIGDYLYVGDIIKTSRRFCRVRAGKVYSRAQIESWNRLEWQGKRGPAFENRGGWNCRHHWRPVRKEWLDGDVEVKEFVAPKEPPAKKAPAKKATTKRKAAPAKAKRKVARRVAPPKERTFVEERRAEDARIKADRALARRMKAEAEPITPRRRGPDPTRLPAPKTTLEARRRVLDAEAAMLRTTTPAERAHAEVVAARARVAEKRFRRLKAGAGPAGPPVRPMTIAERATAELEAARKLEGTAERAVRLSAESVARKEAELIAAGRSEGGIAKGLADRLAERRGLLSDDEIVERIAVRLRSAEHTGTFFLPEGVTPEDYRRLRARARAGLHTVTPVSAGPATTVRPPVPLTTGEVVASDVLPTTPETLQSAVARKQRSLMNEWADVRELSLDDYVKEVDDHMKRIVGKADVWSRTHANTLSKVLDDGRFKTQFEVNRSGGMLNNEARSAFEERFFGLENPIPSQRPVYGYLSDAADGGFIGPKGYDTISQYGDVAVRMKKGVRARTTFTVGDSLDTSERMAYTFRHSVPVTEPSHKAGIFDPRVTRGNFPDARDPLKIRDMHDHTHAYLEAQIHGQARVEDFAEVVFSREAPDAILQQKLAANNIPWRLLEQ